MREIRDQLHNEGRITRHQIYYDHVTFLTQLGLMPAPAGAAAQ